jgi:hypothetical protein
MAVASQNDTATISLESNDPEVKPVVSADTVPKVSRDKVPISSRLDVLLRLDLSIFLKYSFYHLDIK